MVVLAMKIHQHPTYGQQRLSRTHMTVHITPAAPFGLHHPRQDKLVARPVKTHLIEQTGDFRLLDWRCGRYMFFYG